MDYRIADFILRTKGRHSDIAACGLRGFKPFEVEEQDCQPTLVVEMDSAIDECDYPITRSIHTFDFEQNYAVGELARWQRGYIFTMVRQGVRYTLVKEDDSNLVCSTLGTAEVADPSLVRFGIWVMFGIAMAPLGAIAIHSSVVVKDDKGVLCLGESGTGKSTHTRLWLEHIEGARLLNDDSPIIRIVEGVARVYGSPWSGKTHCYVNKSVPIAGFLRLSQAPHNKIRRHSVLSAIGALLPSCPPAFAYEEPLQDAICNTIAEMIGLVAVYHLECLPNEEAAQLSYATIYGRE